MNLMWRLRLQFQIVDMLRKALHPCSLSEFFTATKLTICSMEGLQKRKVDFKTLWLEGTLAEDIATDHIARIIRIRIQKEAWAKLKSQKPSVDCVFRFFQILSLLLSTKARNEIFDPAFNDLKGDFLNARRCHQTESARRRLTFGFTLSATFMFGNCFWLMCADKARSLVVRLLPDLFKRLWWK